MTCFCLVFVPIFIFALIISLGTPIGAESRITVALKSYYITRAQNGSDLPDWLFSTDERRAAGGNTGTGRVRDGSRTIAEGGNVFIETDEGGGGGAYLPPATQYRDNTPRPRGYSASMADAQPATSSTSRFKQMRDAKRGVGGSGSSSLDSSVRGRTGGASVSAGTSSFDQAPSSSSQYPDNNRNTSYRPPSSRTTPEAKRFGAVGVGGGLPSGPRVASSSSQRR